MIEIGGETYPLPHQAKHSLTGMSWGYHGSGPADLARSLLIHALGDDARCPVCEGAAEVVYDVAADADVPARIAIAHPDDTAIGRYSEKMGCYHCEDGSVVMPSLYQPFKRDVVANLSEAGWGSPDPKSSSGSTRTQQATDISRIRRCVQRIA